MKRILIILIALSSYLIPHASHAQRVPLKQLERYLGAAIGPGRVGYVGLTDTLGDQRYRKLDSIIVSITDSLIGLIPPYIDLDQQYLDTVYILNDTLYLSISNDGEPVHLISLSTLAGDHDWYKVGTTTAPTNIRDSIYTYGNVGIRRPSPEYVLDVDSGDIRVRNIIIGYGNGGANTNTVVGSSSMQSTTSSALNNVAIGYQSSKDAVNTTSTVSVGATSLKSATQSYMTVAVGPGALESALTPFYNVAIGAYALSGATNPSFNTAVGYASQYQATGDANLSFGAWSLAYATGGSNVAMGAYSLFDCIGCTENIGIGARSMENNITGVGNIGIGGYVLNSATNPYKNVSIGSYAQYGCTDCAYSIAIGGNSLLSGSSYGYNVAIGFNSLKNALGSNNLAIGFEAGYGSISGSRSIFIGDRAGYYETGSDKLYIEPTLSTTPLIYGDFAGDTIRINGSLQVTNRTGTPNALAGWRYMDSKATEVQLGPRLYMSSDTLRVLSDDTDTDQQYFDTAVIVSDTLILSIFNDGRPAARFDLKQYIDTAAAFLDTDAQYFDTAVIQDDTLILSIFGDNQPAYRFDLKQYIDTAAAFLDTDAQYADTFVIVGNQLRHSLIRDGKPYDSVDLSPYLDNTDNQVIDTFVIVGNQLRNSLSGDGEPYHSVDLSPYIDAPQTYTHLGTTSYTNNLSISGSSFTLQSSNGITTSHDGIGTTTFSGASLQWMLAAQSGSPATIGDAGSAETVSIVGTGAATTSITGNTVAINVPADVDNYVTGASYSLTTNLLTLTRTGALGSLTALIMDHDWYKVGTTRPPDAITDEMFHTGKTGIGMNPTFLLDVAEDARIYGHRVGRGANGSLTNVGLGVNMMQSITSGVYNAVVGSYALTAGTSAYSNSVLGSYAMLSATTAFQNVAIGDYALSSATTTFDNVAIGHYALHDITVSGTASGNIGIGSYAMQYATGGTFNIGLGYAALERNTTGSSNIAFGVGSLSQNSTGSFNTAISDGSMIYNKTGEENVAIGPNSLKYDSLGYFNVAIGTYALERMVGTYDQSTFNTAVGGRSARNMYGKENTSIGGSSLRADTTGSKVLMNGNISIGYRSMYSATGTPDYNTVIGYEALTANNGDNNIVIGYQGGSGLTTGDNNTIIGAGMTFTSTDDGLAVLANGLGVRAIHMLPSGYTGMGGETVPTQKLHLSGNIRVTGAYYDSNNDPGTAGQILSSTVTGTDWITAASGSGSGTVTSIGLTQPAAGITVTSSGTNPITTAGTFTLALANDLAALEALATTGVAVRTGTSTWTTRTLTAGTNISITNGDGVSGNPTITNTMANPTLGFSPGSSTILHFVNPGGSSVIFQAGTGVALSATATQLTISATDALTNNEGSLTLAYGSTTDAVKIKSNTAGSTDVTIKIEGAGTTLTGTSSMAFTLPPMHYNGAGQINGIGPTGISVTAGTGLTLSGASYDNIRYSLADDALALENLSSTGIAVRTGTSSWTTRSITAGAGISVSNGDGVSGNITISSTGGSGTVTSVGITAGAGISVSGSPITSSGSITISSTGITGSGTASGSTYYIPKFTGSTAIGNSVMYQDAGNTLTIAGNLIVTGSGNGNIHGVHGYFDIINVSDLRIGTILSGNLPTYATDAAAGSGGLVTGTFYKTSTGEVRIKL